MAAPYNPPKKGEDYVLRVPLRANPRSAQFPSNLTFDTGDFKVDKDGAGLVKLTTSPYTQSLLLHADGSDGSTTVTDSGPFANTLVASNGAHIETSQSKFGGSSLEFDGTDDYVKVTSGDGSLFAFGTGDFTVDFWARRKTGFGSQFFYAAGTSFIIYYSASVAYHHPPSADRITGTTTLVADTWYHIAVTRQAGVTRLFVNGTQEGGDYSPDTLNVPAHLPTLGADDAGTSFLYNGFIDELRVVKGVALWTANFTPPASAYSTEGVGGMILIPLSSSEMNADVVTIVGVDQSVPKRWEDFVHVIHTVA